MLFLVAITPLLTLLHSSLGVALARPQNDDTTSESIIATATIPTNTATSPTASTTVNDGNITVEYVFERFAGCSNLERHAILDSLREAHEILSANGNVHFATYYYNSMNAVDFLGSPRAMKLSNRRLLLQENLSNARLFATSYLDDKRSIIFCRKGSMPGKEDACGSSAFPDPIVVVNEFENDKTGMLFCDDWFNLSTLRDAIQNGKNSRVVTEKYDLAAYENRARAVITALMLDQRIGTGPTNPFGKPRIRYAKYFPAGQATRYALSAEDCKAASKLGLPSTPLMENADTISWYALASYVQDPAGIGEYPVFPLISNSMAK